MSLRAAKSSGLVEETGFSDSNLKTSAISFVSLGLVLISHGTLRTSSRRLSTGGSAVRDEKEEAEVAAGSQGAPTGVIGNVAPQKFLHPQFVRRTSSWKP